MTATCTICGELFKVTPDARGASHTLGLLGSAFRKHMDAKKHWELPQKALDPSIMGGTIAHLGPAMDMTLRSLIMLSYLISEDAGFNDQLRQLREVIEKVIGQKPREEAAAIVAPPPAAV